MKKYFSIVIFLLFFQINIQAQSVVGKVISRNNKSVIQSAQVSVIQNGGLPKLTVNSDNYGAFEIGPVKDTFTLEIQATGFAVFTGKFVIINSANLNIGNIYLDSSISLKEVNIKVNAAVSQQKGDTTEINAAAFKTNPDATTEDLLRKMPGMTFENGKLKANGEEIKKVTVDGKEFFGDDASVAMKNLPAEVVDKIQVFDRMSDQARLTGFDDGQSSRSINIKTKSGKANGVFGKVYAGYGTDDRYQAGFSYNKFKGNKRITLLGLSNNINQQNFASQDLVGISSGGGMRGGPGNMRGPGGYFEGSAQDNFLVGQSSGINTAQALGLNYSDKYLNKITIGASYFFNYSENVQESSIFRTYANNSISGINQYYTQGSKSLGSSLNHRGYARIEYEIDSNNTLIFTPKVNWQNTSSMQTGNAVNYTDADSLNSIANEYRGKAFGDNYSATLFYSHKFKKVGRTFTGNVEGQKNTAESSYTNNLSNRRFTPTDSIWLTGQLIEALTPNKTVNMRGTFTEALGKKTMFQFDYRYGKNMFGSEQVVNNQDSGSNEYTSRDLSLSNEYSANYITHTPSAMIRFRGEKFWMGTGIAYQFAILEGISNNPGNQGITNKYKDILPRLFFNYKFNKTSNLRGRIMSNTQAPSIAQLQNVISTSNASLLSVGNPALDQELRTNVNISMTSSNPAKSTTLYAGITGSVVNGMIANTTGFITKDTQISENFIALKGTQISKPINLEGYKTGNLLLSYGFPIKKIKSNLNIDGNLGFSAVPGLINDIKNLASTVSTGGGVVLSSNISENFDFSLSMNHSMYNTKNSSQKQLDNKYNIQSARLRLNYIIKSRIVLNTENVYSAYNGLGTNFNQKFMLWNAGIGYKFLEKNAGELRLSCFDILNQNRAINRTVNALYIEDNFTKVLSRYFMLTFTYNIRKFEGQIPEEQKKGSHFHGPVQPSAPGR